MKIQYLFNKLNEKFPLHLMGENFEGSHSITCREKQIELGIWTLGKVFVFGLNKEELDMLETEEGCDKAINFILEHTNNIHQSK